MCHVGTEITDGARWSKTKETPPSSWETVKKSFLFWHLSLFIYSLLSQDRSTIKWSWSMMMYMIDRSIKKTRSKLSVCLLHLDKRQKHNLILRLKYGDIWKASYFSVLFLCLSSFTFILHSFITNKAILISFSGLIGLGVKQGFNVFGFQGG